MTLLEFDSKIPLQWTAIGRGAHRITAMRPWVRSSAGTYWHIPRTARSYESGRMGVSYWCGASSSRLGETRIDTPDEATLCGTCVGRYLGQGRRDDLIFSPVDRWSLPKQCPFTDVTWKHACPYCGGTASWSYGVWHGASQKRHRAGPGLVDWEPCYWHGWEYMTTSQNGIVYCGGSLRGAGYGSTSNLCGEQLQRR